MKKLKLLSAIPIIALTSMLLVNCGGSKDDNIDPPGGGGGGGNNECNGVNATFSSVLSIVTSRCAISGCHAAGSSNGPGALTDYAKISAAKNMIMDAAVNNSRMPASGGPLTAAQKLTIRCWVNSGAPNN